RDRPLRQLAYCSGRLALCGKVGDVVEGRREVVVRTEAAQHHAGAFVPHELVHAPVARVERVERRGLVRERGLTPVVLPGPEVGELLVAQAPSGYDGVGVPALVTVTHRVDDGECARERS